MGFLGFPGGSEVKKLPSSAVDLSLIPGLGKSPGEGNGNALQYSCLGILMDRGVHCLASTCLYVFPPPYPLVNF